MYLYGTRPVLERLHAAPYTVQHIYLEEGASILPAITALARSRRRPVTTLSRAAFSKRAGNVHAQGIVADVTPFTYTAYDTLCAHTELRPLLLFLDRITDPQNLGAIVRTMACLGGAALVLPKHAAAEMNDTVLRVACGGENYVPVARVANISQAMATAKKSGYWIAGATATGGTALADIAWPQPLGIVLGSEGDGIRPGLTKHLDLHITLPMCGAALSFNVATAAALIVYDVQRSRQGVVS